MKKLMILSALALFFAQSLALAQQEIDNRVQNQDARIQQGVNNGTMTPGQAARRKAADNRIENRAAKDAAANGGHLTPGESRRLNRRLNRNSRKIYRDKHDKGN